MEGDEQGASVYNGQQLALKVSANSGYGFFGTTLGKGVASCKPISASVTAQGRWMIDTARRCCMHLYSRRNGYRSDARVVYGDSVTEDTPLLCRDPATGQIVLLTMDELVASAAGWRRGQAQGDAKEYAQPAVRDLEVWSDRGFTKIKHVMRHRTQKKIYRVLTRTGSVDVTEDHSLLDASGAEVSPKDVSVGSRLLHSQLPTDLIPSGRNDPSAPLSEKEAWTWGLFYADGCCNAHGTKPKSYAWRISKRGTGQLDKAREYLNELYRDSALSFKVVDAASTPGAYNLVPVGGGRALVERYRPLFYHPSGNVKRVPACILNASREIRQAFFDGYRAGDGGKGGHGHVRCDSKGKIGAAGLCFLMESLGYPVSINDRRGEPTVFRVTGTRAGDARRSRQRKEPCGVKKLYEVTAHYAGQYVYDLETENHHFAAGVGRLVVHNTDSIMVRTGPYSIYEIMYELRDGRGPAKQPNEALGPRASREITGHNFRAPQLLDFEKIYLPYLLMGKKRYAADKFVIDGKLLGLFDRMRASAEGMRGARSSDPKLVRDVLKGVIDRLTKKVKSGTYDGSKDADRTGIAADNAARDRVIAALLEVVHALVRTRQRVDRTVAQRLAELAAAAATQSETPEEAAARAQIGSLFEDTRNGAKKGAELAKALGALRDQIAEQAKQKRIGKAQADQFGALLDKVAQPVELVKILEDTAEQAKHAASDSGELSGTARERTEAVARAVADVRRYACAPVRADGLPAGESMRLDAILCRLQRAVKAALVHLDDDLKKFGSKTLLDMKLWSMRQSVTHLFLEDTDDNLDARVVACLIEATLGKVCTNFFVHACVYFA